MTLCIVMSAVDDGEIMMMGLSCFFFCGIFCAGAAAACAACLRDGSSLSIFSRGAISALTESKFCGGSAVDQSGELQLRRDRGW